jgi:hypothetical protein
MYFGAGAPIFVLGYRKEAFYLFFFLAGAYWPELDRTAHAYLQVPSQALSKLYLHVCSPLCESVDKLRATMASLHEHNQVNGYIDRQQVLSNKMFVIEEKIDRPWYNHTYHTIELSYN